jgi:hypothetical protein
MTRILHDRQQELWALLESTPKPSKGLAIFVHGFRGSYLGTWGRLGEFLRANADSDSVFRNWDYLFLGYETDTVDTFLNIARLIAGKWASAESGKPPFSHRYAKLALFGHSLGTLGIRQLLCAISEQPKSMATALQSVSLLGSPMNGSPLARFGLAAKLVDARRRPMALLPGTYRVARALAPNSPELQMLQCWTDTARDDPRSPRLAPLVVLGADDLVAGTGGLAMRAWKGDDVRVEAVGHLAMTKLDSTAHDAKALLLDIVRKGLSA